MRVLAVLFRLFALIGLLGLAGLLWLKFDTQTKQQIAFMDEVIDDAYTVLQSEKRPSGKIFLRKSVLLMMFLMPMNRYLTEMKICCRSQSKHWTHQSRFIYRNQDYRDRLESSAKEYGPGSLYWDSQDNMWKISDDYKLESPAGFKDPFEDESKFPLKIKNSKMVQLSKELLDTNALGQLSGCSTKTATTNNLKFQSFVR